MPTPASPPITLPPAQSLRKVYGLRWSDVEIVGSDLDLSFAAMDAPDLIPAGSMMALHGSPRVIVERLTRRGREDSPMLVRAFL